MVVVGCNVCISVAPTIGPSIILNIFCCDAVVVVFMVCVPLVSALAGVVLVVFGLPPKILMGAVPLVETVVVERKKKNQTARAPTSKINELVVAIQIVILLKFIFLMEVQRLRC